jgi:AcrR family transcriptional regulator
MAEPTEIPSARQTAILEAALSVFSRYGLKKTSMDDLARAAGLSRQGLYLHYSTKEALFRAAVLHVVGAMRAAGESALGDESSEVEVRLSRAYEAMHAVFIGTAHGEHMTELMAAAAELLGPVVPELEEGIIASVAALLRKSGVAARWKAAGISAKDLAVQLDLTSRGLKHSAKDVAEYRAKMGIATRMICRGGG